MIQIIHLSFTYTDEIPLFHELNVNLGRARHGLVGPNASGKSTLMALIAGQLTPQTGTILREAGPVQYVSQLDAYSKAATADLSVIQSGRRIQADKGCEADWVFMEDRWPLYAAVEQQLDEWGLGALDFSQSQTFSGGTWQRLRLALALAHGENFLLLDEPSNHLDREGRVKLIEALRKHRAGCLIASHDRELLNAMDLTLALEAGRVQVYGGPYDFYRQTHDEQQAAFHAAYSQGRQELAKARGMAQRVREKQTKKSAQGYRNRDKLGLPRIAFGLRRMQAEGTAARLAAQHEEKIAQLEEDLREKAQKLIEKPELHCDVKGTRRPGDRPLLAFENLQYQWTETALWQEPLHLQLGAGEHLAILGDNGSGKSTLLRLIMGQLQPSAGRIHRRFREVFLLDQDLASLPRDKSLLTIWNDPLYLADAGLRRTIAARLGLKAREAETPLVRLSGGQRLRAALVLLATRITPPDLILLDEPTNHLDLDAIESLVATLRALPSSLIVVTHDFRFLQDLEVHQRFELVRAR